MNSHAAPEFRGVSWQKVLLGLAGAVIAATTAVSVNDSARATGLAPWTEANPPSFELPRLGEPIAATYGLGGQTGDAVLVHFFASWCEPCREELPALKRLSERGAPRLRVVAIAVADNDAALRRVVDATGVTFPILLDRDRAVARAWSISALPSTVILDSRHTARLVVESDFAWDTIEPSLLIGRLSSPPAPASLPPSAHAQQKPVTQGGH